MWALRSAANPVRSQSLRIMLSRTCCVETNILIGNIEHEVVGENHAPRGWAVPAREYSSSTRSFLWSRSLSSQSGAKSSDGEDELEYGFSDLNVTPESEKAEDVMDDEEVVLEGDITEKESDEIAESETEGILGLSDVETESKNGNQKVRRVASSPLSQILLESPQQSLQSTLDQWVSEGKPLGREEIHLVLLNLRKRKLYGKALQFLGWVKENLNLEFTDREYVSHVDLIAKVKGIHMAEKYIEKIPESFKGEPAYRTLLANSVAIGGTKKSEEIFNKIRDLGFPLTTFVCNQLLLLYKRHDRKKIADVLKMMEKEDVEPSLFTYRLLIDIKGQAKDIQGMEDLVKMMKEGGIEPDLQIKAMLAKYYSFEKLNEKAEAVLKEIEGDDVRGKNRDACRELLPLYATLGKAGDVERIWKVCEANPRLEECLAAIEAWGKLGEVQIAEQVFEDMMKTWKKLSARFYNAMLKVYANHKLLSKGKELAKRMSENGCRIGPLTWDVLVNLYVEAGEVKMGDLILEKAMQQNQMRPLYSSYVVLLENYAKRGDVHNAEKMFHKSRQSGYAARLRLYQTLLRAYVIAKVPAYGFRERMKADNMFPNKALAEQLAFADPFKKTTTPLSDLIS